MSLDVALAAVLLLELSLIAFRLQCPRIPAAIGVMRPPRPFRMCVAHAPLRILIRLQTRRAVIGDVLHGCGRLSCQVAMATARRQPRHTLNALISRPSCTYGSPMQITARCAWVG